MCNNMRDVHLANTASRNAERQFRDQRDPDTIITESQIKLEYGQHIADGSIDPAEQTFAQYLLNCMESQGGTLSEYVPEEDKLSEFIILVRETHTLQVRIEADSMQEALEEAERQYQSGEICLEHNCFAGAEFRPCCSECESDFDDNGCWVPDGLRVVNDGTPLLKVLCDHCVADMENSGELTRCECCGDVFDPSLLKVNPKNSIPEICPHCGEIWCD